MDTEKTFRAAPTMYTVVDEGYNVTLHRSLKSVMEFVRSAVRGQPMAVSPNSEDWDDVKTIQQYIRTEPCSVELYPVDSNDWTYKIEIHRG